MTDDRNQDNLTEEQRAEIGRKGGEASSSKQDMSELGSKAHENGAHEFNSEEAEEAGEIGGSK